MVFNFCICLKNFCICLINFSICFVNVFSFPKNAIIMSKMKFNVSESHVFGFRQFRPFKKVELVDCDYREPIVEGQLSEDSLLDTIFSVDPKTSLPSGDCAMFMNENTSPEVRDYIRQNLMSPVQASDAQGKYGELSDDDIANFTRGSNESITSYRDRLMKFVSDSVKQQQANAAIQAVKTDVIEKSE